MSNHFGLACCQQNTRFVLLSQWACCSPPYTPVPSPQWHVKQLQWRNISCQCNTSEELRLHIGGHLHNKS